MSITFENTNEREHIKSHSHEEHRQHAFDSFCIKTLKYSARSYYRKLKTIANQHTLLSELSDNDMLMLSTSDKYFKSATKFEVQGLCITVSDKRLATALLLLPEEYRSIILLSFFLEMSDREISERLHLVRRTVTYRRTKKIQDLKDFLENYEDE